MSEEYIAATVKYNASGESTALPPHLSNGRYDQVDTTTLHKGPFAKHAERRRPSVWTGRAIFWNHEGT